MTSITTAHAQLRIQAVSAEPFEQQSSHLLSVPSPSDEKPPPGKQLEKQKMSLSSGVTGGKAVLPSLQRSCSVLRGGRVGNGVSPRQNMVHPFLPGRKGRHSQSLTSCGSCDVDELSFKRIAGENCVQCLAAAEGKQTETKRVRLSVLSLAAVPSVMYVVEKGKHV